MIGVCVLVAVGTGVWLYRTIAGPLHEAKEVAERVAAGDFSATFPRHTNDEIGALVSAVEAMKDAVVGKVSIMREMAGAVLVTAESLRASVATVSESAGNNGNASALAEMDDSSQLLADLATQLIES
jgi:methyl-accepting chemotaxis protein